MSESKNTRQIAVLLRFVSFFFWLRRYFPVCNMSFFKLVVILRLLESNVNKFGIQSSNSQISKSMSKQNTMAAWTHFHFGTMEVKKWCMAKNFNWCFHAILTFLNIHLKYRTHVITSCSLNFLILLFLDGILANITICT